MVLRPGENCWRTARAERAAVLIDVADYFEAFAAAAERAQRSICIVGWDFNGNIRLRRRGESGKENFDETLGDFLNRLVESNRKLHVHILAWDFAMMYAPEREILPLYRNDWRAHRRVHFELDGEHPLGASHHQKIVVIDDQLAFVGGIDFARRRWDTSAHAPSDERRSDPSGVSYGPFHDVQMMVEGPIASAVGDLVEMRWQHGAGSDLDRRGPSSKEELWPESVEPDLRDVEIAIARTQPALRDQPEVREIEQSYLDCVANARESIYIENQYFTAASVGDALAERLETSDAPEVVVVSRHSCSGWLEDHVMGTLRAELLRRLESAAPDDRFKAYFPIAGGEAMDLHSKIMIVDDRVLRIGSANLANRSMGLDTECDLIVEARDKDHRQGIATVRARLLADHLGVEAEQVLRAISENASLGAAIEALRTEEKSLAPLTSDTGDGSWVRGESEVLRVADPEKPVEPELFETMFPHGQEESDEGGGTLGVVLGLAAFVGLAIAWKWTPLGDLISPEQLAAWLEPWSGSPVGVALAVGVFVGASIAMVPITLLIGAYGVVFEPLTATAISLSSSVASAALAFAFGRRVPRRTVRRVAGERLNAISAKVQGAGAIVPLALLRLVPVAPFTVFNLVAGAMHVPRAAFLIATAIGLLPGTVVLVSVGSGLREGRFGVGLAALGVVGLLAVVAGGFYARRRQDSAQSEDEVGG